MSYVLQALQRLLRPEYAAAAICVLQTLLRAATAAAAPVAAADMVETGSADSMRIEQQVNAAAAVPIAAVLTASNVSNWLQHQELQIQQREPVAQAGFGVSSNAAGGRGVGPATARCRCSCWQPDSTWHYSGPAHKRAVQTCVCNSAGRVKHAACKLQWPTNALWLQYSRLAGHRANAALHGRPHKPLCSTFRHCSRGPDNEPPLHIQCLRVLLY